jgi:hypothetical protein
LSPALNLGNGKLREIKRQYTPAISVTGITTVNTVCYANDQTIIKKKEAESCRFKQAPVK